MPPSSPTGESPGASGAGTEPPSTVAAPDALAAVDVSRRLRAAELELSRVRARLARVESSTAYRLGLALTDAARNPRSAPVQLPRAVYSLYRRWRGAGGPAVPRAAAPRAKTASPSLPGATRERAAPAPAAPTEPAEDLGRLLVDAAAIALLPHDRPVVAGPLSARTTEALSRYAVVNAVTPNTGLELLRRSRPDVLLVDSSVGVGGPWAGLGSYDAPERERDLLELAHAAREAGVPIALWRSAATSVAPFFYDAAHLFDVLLAEKSDTAGGSDGVALWDPGLALDADAEPASGGQVLGPGHAQQRRRALRARFLEQATPVRLAELLRSVGGSYDLPTRSVAVLAALSDTFDAAALLASLAAQRLRPREVLVAGSGSAAAVDALRAEGLGAELWAPSAGAAWPATAARGVASTWVAVRREPFASPHHLLDLVLAAEASDADAVGYGGEEFRYVDDLDTTRALVRTDVLRREGLPESSLRSWHEVGRRLFALLPEETWQPDESGSGQTPR